MYYGGKREGGGEAVFLRITDFAWLLSIWIDFQFVEARKIYSIGNNSFVLCAMQ